MPHVLLYRLVSHRVYGYNLIAKYSAKLDSTRSGSQMYSRDALIASLVQQVEEELLILPFHKWMTAYEETIKIIKEKIPSFQSSHLDEQHARIWYFRYRRQSFETYTSFLDSILHSHEGNQRQRGGLLEARILPETSIPGHDLTMKRRKISEHLSPSDPAYLKSLYTRREKVSQEPSKPPGKSNIWRKSSDKDGGNPQVVNYKREITEGDTSVGMDDGGSEKRERDAFWNTFESEPMLVSLLDEVDEDGSAETLRVNVSPLPIPTSRVRKAYRRNHVRENRSWKKQLKLIQVPSNGDASWKAYVIDKLNTTPPKPAFLSAEKFDEDRLNRFEDPRYAILFETSESPSSENGESSLENHRSQSVSEACKLSVPPKSPTKETSTKSTYDFSSVAQAFERKSKTCSEMKPKQSISIPVQEKSREEFAGQRLPIPSICPPPVPAVPTSAASVTIVQLSCKSGPLLATPGERQVHQLSLPNYSTSSTFPGNSAIPWKTETPTSYWQPFPASSYPGGNHEEFFRSSQSQSYPKAEETFQNFRLYEQQQQRIPPPPPRIGEPFHNFHRYERRPPPPPLIGKRHAQECDYPDFYRDAERACPRRYPYPRSNFQDFNSFAYLRRFNDGQGSYLEEIR